MCQGTFYRYIYIYILFPTSFLKLAGARSVTSITLRIIYVKIKKERRSRRFAVRFAFFCLFVCLLLGLGFFLFFFSVCVFNLFCFGLVWVCCCCFVCLFVFVSLLCFVVYPFFYALTYMWRLLTICLFIHPFYFIFFISFLNT